MQQGEISGDEIQALRRLVSFEADRSLANWGRWRRQWEGPEGYATRSAGLATGGVSAHDSFDHMCDDADIRSAEIADSVIDELCVQYKIAIQHVYEAAVWNFRRMSKEQVFIAAVGEFWRKAKTKGLT